LMKKHNIKVFILKKENKIINCINFSYHSRKYHCS
jgi:hypothetical protein